MLQRISILNEPLLNEDHIKILQNGSSHKDYSSVENIVKLPMLRKIEPQQNLFPPVEAALKSSTIISNRLKNSMIDLRQNLRSQFTTFDKPDQFDFDFPISKFPSVPKGQSNLITYQQKNIVQDEDTFKQRLSNEQIQQISLNGQFKVKSNQQYITLPYIWKINDFLFKGKKNISQIWYNTLASAHKFIYHAYQTLKQQVPKEAISLAKLPKRLFSLIFGKKSQIVHYSVDYNRQIAKDFWNQVLDKYYEKSKQFGSELFQYLDAQYTAEDHITILNTGNIEQYNIKTKAQSDSRLKYQQRLNIKNQKKIKILNVSNQFDVFWQKNRKKIFNQVSDQHSNQINKQQNLVNKSQILMNKQHDQNDQLLKKQNDQEILQKFNDRKFTLYTNFLQKRLPQITVPLTVIEAIINLLCIIQIMNKKQRKHQNIKRLQKQRIQKQIKQNHQIISLNDVWYYKKVNQTYQPIQKKLKNQQQKRFINQELKKLNIKQRKVYDLWIQYKKTYQTRTQAKKIQKPQIMKASRTFFSTFYLLPPYKIIKTDYGNGNNSYQMIKQESMNITTDSYFWKIKLYCMRIKCWTINCVVFLIYLCYKGPFGIRCLYGVQQFSYDQYILSGSGQVMNQKRKPVLGTFLKVIYGMQKSRQNFEGLPDRGLFGKNFGRLFNYIQCYVFRFIIVGLLITLILYPIAILTSSVLMGLLIFTVWAWMPVVLLVTYLFNILIFQFESSTQPYGFFVRSFPILSLIISFLLSIGKILLIIIWFIVISPLVCLFIILFAILHRLWRTLTDFIMLFLIRTLGRTPSNNTAIAKKISGPGMSKQYYMSINQQDAYILIQAELQQILMVQFNRIFNINLLKPVNRFNQVVQLVIKPLNMNNYTNNNNIYLHSSDSSNPIHKSVNNLSQNYNKKYNNYMARYPRRPYNVRFTQQQIDNYFENTVAIVKNFIQKNNFEGWIFQQYNLVLYDYEQLTRKIWCDVYGCGQQIFEPLQKIDQRFKLQDQYRNTSSSLQRKKNVNSVLQALNGQIDLKPRRANVVAYHHGLLSNQHRVQMVGQLLSQIDKNSEACVGLGQSQVKSILCPHLRIKQVIKKDNHQYNYQSRIYK